MLIKQFQLENSSEEEKQLIPEFCEWLIRQMFDSLNTSLNREKILIRLEYLYKNGFWIRWQSSRSKNININQLMNNIYNSFDYNQYKLNTWRINTNKKVLIPNTYTQIDKLIRFIDFGDINIKGTGIFSCLQRNFNANKLNKLYQLFIINKLGIMPNAKLITD